ncbi:pentapeptide repeat-containing protein [Chamaesiphon sp. OTE_20_metabat_361]|uniref:pentapeptide repeat-containing protein n=1 Tax=Chamaesiphon sp. OTE_20_metabat_361 TaxID=2964689 RepID=UPI00286ACA4E|nr:pentapeptide repeat-containing protein [Chamaesiphon sp. OTE_20_metabat_361]
MAWEITTTELLERYAIGERNFAGIELLPPPGTSNAGRQDGIELQGAILRDINLRGADLSFADLTGADLTGADLFAAYLEMAILEGAIVKNANLRGANLRWCRLRGANFEGTELIHVNAAGADFREAFVEFLSYSILAQADFKGAKGTYTERICSQANFVWETTLPDGTIEHRALCRGNYWLDP